MGLDVFENVPFGEASRWPLLVCGLVCQPLEALVCWRCDAGQSAQQHNLAVQVVGFDGTRSSSEALPGRTPDSWVSRNISDLEQVPSTLAVLFLRCKIDTGRTENRDALLPDHSPKRSAPCLWTT